MAKAVGSTGPPRGGEDVCEGGRRWSEMFQGFLQSVHHQELDDEPLRLPAEVRKHALLERHVVVPDVQGRGSVVLAGEGRHAGQAETGNVR